MGVAKKFFCDTIRVTCWCGLRTLKERLVTKMKRQKLEQIEHMKRTALCRKNSAWLAYAKARRRFLDAQDVLLFAQEELDAASDNPENNRDGDVRLQIARKRHRSAQEEFQYQMQEHRRLKAELSTAQKEYRYWCGEYWRGSATIKICRRNEAVSN